MLAGVLLVAIAGGGPLEADVVLRGGTIHDGTGGKPAVGDVAIKGDRIVAVGTFAVKGSTRVVEAKGLVIAPGFIDLHSHSDYPLQNKATRGNLSFLYQGATTVVTGNCGAGPTDVDGYFKTLEKNGVGSNVLHLVPHNAVRREVMKNANRAPSADELRQLEALVERGMKAGACGLSTGLIYNPGTYARTDEIVALARVAAKYGGLYASHIRNEETGVLAAVAEALQVGREAGLPVHISHLKANSKAMWGKSADLVAAIARARKAGQAVTADQYPYEASSTSLAAMVIPPRWREGTADDFQKRLADADLGPAIRKASEAELAARDGGASLRVARYTPRPEWQGKDLAAIARAEKKTPLEVALEVEKHGGAQMVSFGMSMEDVRFIMRQPFVATASDGSSQAPGDSVPHPRSYGTFPRKIGRFALAEGVLSVEQAIRSATGLPADILGLKDRGYLRPGYFADVVVFDPATFHDTATYEKPHQYATGVRHLFVNGQEAIAGGKATGKLAGRPIRAAKR